jgi:hypothetical protein
LSETARKALKPRFPGRKYRFSSWLVVLGSRSKGSVVPGRWTWRGVSGVSGMSGVNGGNGVNGVIFGHETHHYVDDTQDLARRGRMGKAPRHRTHHTG